jgi:hypothetical protein
MNVPYEFCAYRFLELWERSEKPLHIALSGTPSGGQIRDALKYYRVARTFKGLCDEFAEKISEDLVEVSDRCEGDFSDKVTSLAERFKKNFDQFNLSAASKLLWLRNRHHYVIYDSRAVTALCRLGNKFNKADYSSYSEVWKVEYQKRSDEISLAAHGLVTLPRKYTAAFTLTDNELTELVDSEWFIERVFDIYLWEIGVAKQTNLPIVIKPNRN